MALCSPFHTLSVLTFRNSQADCLWATQHAEVSKSSALLVGNRAKKWQPLWAVALSSLVRRREARPASSHPPSVVGCARWCGRVWFGLAVKQKGQAELKSGGRAGQKIDENHLQPCISVLVFCGKV